MHRYFLLLFLPVLFACPYGYKYNSASITEDPVNLEAVNSEYDDYNATAPWIRDEFPLVFSSNRHSQGSEMDFVYKYMALEFSKETAEWDFYNETNSNLTFTKNHNSIQYLVNEVNDGKNQFGPYILSYWYDLPNVTYEQGKENDFLMLYATETSNKLDIRFISNRNDTLLQGELISINSPANEAYPSFNQDFSRLYFCSDYVGKYQIYSVPMNSDLDIEDNLQLEEPNPWLEELILNSEGNDKCPFIDGNILVFTSDREGGFGGYDLYYSTWENDKWSDPVNFGEKVNSPQDEFRPILRSEKGFENSLLLFSSNRPGGKGGFDLYYVGVSFEE